jgi:hypothetical protein
MIIDSADDDKVFFGPSAASHRVEAGSPQGFSRFIPQSPKGTILFIYDFRGVGSLDTKFAGKLKILQSIQSTIRKWKQNSKPNPTETSIPKISNAWRGLYEGIMPE